MVKKCKKAFKMLTSLSIAVVMLVITMAPVMAKEVRKTLIIRLRVQPISGLVAIQVLLQ